MGVRISALRKPTLCQPKSSAKVNRMSLGGAAAATASRAASTSSVDLIRPTLHDADAPSAATASATRIPSASPAALAAALRWVITPLAAPSAASPILAESCEYAASMPARVVEETRERWALLGQHEPCGRRTAVRAGDHDLPGAASVHVRDGVEQHQGAARLTHGGVGRAAGAAGGGQCRIAGKICDDGSKMVKAGASRFCSSGGQGARTVTVVQHSAS